MVFTLGYPLGKPDKPLPGYVQKGAVPPSKSDSAERPRMTTEVQVPIEVLGKSAAGLGHLNSVHDVDGGIRYEPLVLDYFGQLYPSLSMMVAARSLNLSPADIKVALGESVSLGNLKIRTDPQLQMYTYFYKDRDGRAAFPVDSFYDVYVGKIPADKYRDKIVLIGATAVGVGTAFVTPVSPATPPIVTLAHSVSSILSEHFFVAPQWGYAVELLLFAVIAAYLIGLLPKLKAGQALAISGGVFVALLAAHFILITSNGTWLQLMLPATLLLLGHGALVSKRFIVTEAAKIKSDETGAESNRMLGIAYQ